MARKKKNIGIMISTLYGNYASALWRGIRREIAGIDANFITFPGRTERWPGGFNYQSSSIYKKIQPASIDALLIVAGTYGNRMEEGEFNAFFERYRDIPGVSIGLPVPHKRAILIDNASGIASLVRHLARDHGRTRFATVTGPLGNSEARIRLNAFREAVAANGFVVREEFVRAGLFVEESGRAAVRDLFAGKSLDEAPDAIVCQNDYMAFGAIRELQRMGIRVPAEVSVTGFDDVEEAEISFPSLTTVNQPLAAQAALGVRHALAACEGTLLAGDVILPTETMIRASCGCYSCGNVHLAHCLPQTAPEPSEREHPLIDLFWEGLGSRVVGLENAPEKREASRAIFDAIEGAADRERELERFASYLHAEIEEGRSVKPWVTLVHLIQIFFEGVRDRSGEPAAAALFLSSCFQTVLSLVRAEQGKRQFFLANQVTLMRTYLGTMASALDVEDVMAAARDQFRGIGVTSFFIVQYDAITQRERGADWAEPGAARLVFGYLDGEEVPRRFRGAPIDGGELLPRELLAAGGCRELIASSLHFMTDVIGYMVIDHNDVTRELYDILSGHVSSSLKTAFLFAEREESERRLREVLDDLERSNTQLQRISENDELTGLYNRRGFLTVARRSLELARRMRRSGLVFYADLDGLKRINDVYGHHEGDLAIKAAADVLRATFRNMDVIARLGGDEFTVLALNADEALVPIVRHRLADEESKANERLGKPWRLSISIGFSAFAASDQTPIEKLMRDADSVLYAEKERKREGQD